MAARLVLDESFEDGFASSDIVNDAPSNRLQTGTGRPRIVQAWTIHQVAETIRHDPAHDMTWELAEQVTAAQ